MSYPQVGVTVLTYTGGKQWIPSGLPLATIVIPVRELFM
jgi:hypothetical protein